MTETRRGRKTMNKSRSEKCCIERERSGKKDTVTREGRLLYSERSGVESP